MKNSKTSSVSLNFFGVAIMYTSAIMGAGFASGREIWQFFGVFNENAKWGVFFVGVLFILTGVMASINARHFNTNDMGRVIVPGGNKHIINFVGYFMAVIIFTVLVTMSAAGGSLVRQEFGMSKIFGGAVIIIMVLFTVLGEFERVSRVFRYIMPAMFVIVVMVCLMVIFKDIGYTGYDDPVKPSPIASNFVIAAFLYISYNILSMIPIVATASINAKNNRHAIVGSMLGGLMLAVLAFLLVLALQKDMHFSQALDLPMLGYSAKLSKPVHILYVVVLMLSIYASATSNFYGFTTKIKTGPKKKKFIIVSAWIGFLLGLFGFKNIVAYMFPIEGYLGFLIIIMMTINFIIVIKEIKNEGSKAQCEYIQGFRESR
ncbi:MAG: hypothetical protein JJE03_01170 [Peptostreptococcaceae bacterium]|nr:hypothetical protein [Peptostreptococcaceae bacterium]